MITESKKEVLKLFSEKLKEKNINWCLVGSTNLALQGIDIIPNDIDIATDKEGAYKINMIFKDYETKKIKLIKKYKGFAYFAEYKIGDEEIEVVGELNNDNVYISLIKQGTMNIKLDSKEIPCLKLKKEYEAYKKLKRTEKIMLLKQKLEHIS